MLNVNHKKLEHRVKSEGKFVQVGLHMICTEGSLMGAE